MSQLVYGGQCGKKGIKDVLRTRRTILQNLKMNYIALYYFWCKQKVLVQAEELFDVIDYF